MPKREWLIEARKSKDLSRLALADEVGINETYVEKIENGKRTPRFPVAIRIGKALDIPQDDILLRFYADRTSA